MRNHYLISKSAADYRRYLFQQLMNKTDIQIGDVIQFDLEEEHIWSRVLVLEQDGYWVELANEPLIPKYKERDIMKIPFEKINQVEGKFMCFPTIGLYCKYFSITRNEKLEKDFVEGIYLLVKGEQYIIPRNNFS